MNEWNQQIFERDNYTCQRCGAVSKPGQKWTGFVVHHIVPIKKGGDNSLDNLIVLCRACHAKVHLSINPDKAPADSKQIISNKELFSVPQAAEILNITRSVINYHIGAGRLKAQKIGRAYVIARADLELFEMERTGADYPRSVRDAVDDAVERAYEMKERRDE